MDMLNASLTKLKFAQSIAVNLVGQILLMARPRLEMNESLKAR